MPFSIVELQVLAGLSDGRTLSEIAQQLHFSQPAMSKVLRAAEGHSSMALVEHRGRRVQLTSAGMEIGRTARVVLAQLRGLDQLVEDLQQGKKGTLRIAATMTPANYVLPAAIAEFKGLYLNVDVSLQVVAVGDWRVLLNEGVDLGIGTQGTAPVGWVAQRLYEDPVTFFVPPTSPLAGRDSLIPEELAAEQLIAPWSRGFWTRILGELAARGIDLGRRMDVWPMPAVKHLVEAGYGVGVLLDSAVWLDAQRQRFVRLNVPGADLVEPFYLIRPAVQHPPAVVEAFYRCLRRQVSAMFQTDL